MRQLILASQSVQRQAMLQTLGVEFQVVPSNIDEYAITAESQVERAKAIALAKAQAVAALHPEAVILAADTYVIKDGESLEKPTSKAEALVMLQKQQGQELIEVTGVCLIDPDRPEPRNQVSTTTFSFRPLTQAQMSAYVENNPVTTWSAAFCPAYVEGMSLIAQFSGSFTGFTHGLPIELVQAWLREAGFEV